MSTPLPTLCSESALASYAAQLQERSPELIVIDLNMPATDGAHLGYQVPHEGIMIVMPAGFRHSREGGNPSFVLGQWDADGQIKLAWHMYDRGVITS